MSRRIRIMFLAASVAAGTTFLSGSSNSGAKEPANAIPVIPNATESPALTEPEPVKLNPDSSNPTGRLIEISIKKQRLTAWRDGKIVYRFVISTGREGYETPRGHYKILEKYENRWSRKWSVWMPYAMRIFEGYFIHQLPHKDGSSYNIGAAKLGIPDSHGCVRVNVDDAEQLFKWAKVRTPVWIH